MRDSEKKSKRQQKIDEEIERQREIARKIAEREKREAQERDKRLEQERLELIKLKQNVIEESEIIPETSEEEIKLSFWGKIKNFFYHSKWWLGMAVILVVLAVVLISSLLKRPRPDMIVLFVGENQTVGEESGLSDYIGQFAQDFNNNGEVFVNVYYIPYSEDEQKNYSNGVDTKITAEFQSGEAVIVIGNDKIGEVVNPDDVFVDLTEIYPENKNIKDKYKFMLDGTDFAQRIGVPKEYIKDGMFLAIRKPKKLFYSSKEEIQETYDRDFPVFDSIVGDLSN